MAPGAQVGNVQENLDRCEQFCDRWSDMQTEGLCVYIDFIRTGLDMIWTHLTSSVQVTEITKFWWIVIQTEKWSGSPGSESSALD